jgi:RNA polymerase sigma-70 factor (ECF subfamily)
MSPYQQASDEELLERTHAGDEEAFVALYRRRQGGIFRFALRMSGSESVAEDVTQEVFLKLIGGDLGFDAGRGTLRAYLFGVARKLVLRHFEDDGDAVAESDDNPEEPVAESDVLAELTRREALDALRQAVLALPRRYREVLVLCELEEMDYADAAVALGCAIGTVRSRLHRARALLIDKLNRGGHADPALGGFNLARCLI